MAGDHHSPAAASGSPSHSPPPSETLISQQSTQNDVTPAAHNQQSGIKLPSNRRRSNRKIQTLINAVNLIPFTPKLLVLYKHENVLKRLGLYNFSKIKLDQNIRTDLIAQVIVNYDPKKRWSVVNGKRIRVSRADLARALELPVTKQDINNINNNNLGVFSAEEIEFVDDFVFNWVLIHEESWVMPEKIVRMTECVRDGHPEKLDSASLIWYKVERELALGVKLVDCYYASHLQWLIRSQCEQLFEVKEHIEKVPVVKLTLANETVDEAVDSENNTGEQLLQHCQINDLNNNEEVKVEDDGEHIEKVSIVHVGDVELTLGHETVDEVMDSKNNPGEQLLQLCQTGNLNNNEVNVEDVVDEPIVQVEGENNDDDDGEKFVKGLAMEANDDSFMSHGGPSFFDNNNNNGKRVMESEDDTHHLDMNNKRLKTNDIWDHKQSDFGFCMVQVDQWVEKAKMITESKEQVYVNQKYHQDSEINQLQHRQQVMEMIIKSKNEELGQKHAEVYRLERELYLMVDLLKGYRTALNDEHIKFSEYRKRVGAQEKSDFKDVGLGGPVLSTRELEEVVSNVADVSEEKGGGEED